MRCGGVTKLLYANIDPQVIIDSVCYVCKVPQAHLLAPVTSREQDILIYTLYRYTNLTIESIAQLLGRERVTLSSRLDKMRITLREKNLGYSQQNVDDIRDCIQYTKVLKPKVRKSDNGDRKLRRQIIEAAGLDFLEFIRRPLAEQKKWMKEHKEGYNINTLVHKVRAIGLEPTANVHTSVR